VRGEHRHRNRNQLQAQVHDNASFTRSCLWFECATPFMMGGTSNRAKDRTISRAGDPRLTSARPVVWSNLI
jgi:hypothetical protein